MWMLRKVSNSILHNQGQWSENSCSYSPRLRLGSHDFALVCKILISRPWFVRYFIPYKGRKSLTAERKVATLRPVCGKIFFKPFQSELSNELEAYEFSVLTWSKISEKKSEGKERNRKLAILRELKINYYLQYIINFCSDKTYLTSVRKCFFSKNRVFLTVWYLNNSFWWHPYS
jgi:hypothetical protein